MSGRVFHQIAKLSGSFALAGGVSQWQKSEQQEYSLTGLVFPTTALSYSLFGSSGVQKAARLRPIRANNRDGHEVKIYPVALQVRPIASQFTYYSIRSALLRGTLFTYFPLFERFFRELQEAEMAAEARGEEFDLKDADFPWEEAKRLLPIAMFNSAKEICVGIVRVLLSWASAAYLDDRLAWKLIKEQSSSIKAKSVLPFYQRPFIVARSCVRGTIIPVLAELIVNCALELFKACREQRPWRAKLIRIRRIQTALGVRSIINIVAGSCGAGLIATIQPGFLCTIASVISVFLVDTFICVPEVPQYVKEGRFTRRFSWILAASGTIIVISFLPWIRLLAPDVTEERYAIAPAAY